MNQITHVSTGVEDQSELMAGASHHLRNAMGTGSRRSCAVACTLLTCLAQAKALGYSLRDACNGLSGCLEELTESSPGEVSPE
ncbi:MAG TPA: hypothetical protein VEP67_09970 [Thiobacillaceae bacterium]|nr:hypothetical protein [Thiobacillaceae bacterium]